jgi:prephenate dehydrogenase
VPNQLASRIHGSVHIIGTGLLGASLGLALREHGVTVTLEDASPTALALAVDYGAGRERHEDDSQPGVVIVATPPDVVADVIAGALERFSEAAVTDVTSVKLAPLRELQSRGLDLTRYVGSHPMAGRERGSAIMARTDLFVGRPWVICRDTDTPAWVLSRVENIALEVGGVLEEMTPEDHDEAVGLVSHLPQVVASVLAGQLATAEANHLHLAGGGLRDTTRIAESDAELWVQILSANKDRLVSRLRALEHDVARFAEALEADGSRRAIADLLTAGNRGVHRIPGKHGSDERFVKLTVIIDDRPGQLAHLLSELGDLNVNMEDLRLEHSPGAKIGFAEISVLPEVSEQARHDLEQRGWRIV